MQVLNQLKEVNFTQNGYDVSFDDNGDPVATYELVNWQKGESGTIEMVTVGQYDASLPAGLEFTIHRNLSWQEGSTHVSVLFCFMAMFSYQKNSKMTFCLLPNIRR